MTETQEKMLRGVLDQLMSSYTVSAEELSATHAYLFGKQPMAPFFTDKELFETVLYLQETVRFHHLADLEALVQYYEKRKREMRKYLEEIADSDNDGGEVKPLSLAGAYQLHVADTVAVKPAELDHLNLQITTDAGCFFEQLYIRVLQLFESSPFPSAGEKDVHVIVKRHVRELVLTDEPISMRWPSVESILPGGIQYYVEQFASHSNGARFVIMQFGTNSIGKSQLLAHPPSDWWAGACKNLYRRHFYGGEPPDYAAIMKVIRCEQPISDSNFKLQMTEWLVYSKLIISDCQHPEPDTLARRDLSLKYLFQGDGVRVYSGATMHYWIHNLFEDKLSLKKWVILRRGPGHFWLTSDNPGFLININELQGGFTQVIPRHSLLDIRPDSILYYPLSKDYCLKLEPAVELCDEDKMNLPIDYITSSDEELDFVNGVTVSTYNKVVITNQRKTLQEIQL